MVKNHRSQFLAESLDYAFVVRSKELAKQIKSFTTSILDQGWTRKNEDSDDNGIEFLAKLNIDIDSVIDLDLLERSAKNLEEIADAVAEGLAANKMTDDVAKGLNKKKK